MARKSAQSGRGGLGRSKHVRVKTARGRKSSSTRWLQRQLNDPFVREAQRLGYRSRAAFKIIELHERFGFLKRGARVVDLGAAPGGLEPDSSAICGWRWHRRCARFACYGASCRCNCA